MKIRFNRLVVVEIESSYGELWDKSFHKWDEIDIESINLLPNKKESNILTKRNDVLMYVPTDAYEVI